MADQIIKYNKSEYETAVKAIQTAQSRSYQNNSNFKDSINTTTAQSIINYQTAIQNLKAYLQKYNTILQSDINSLYAIGKTIEDTDNEMSK
jgi:type VII secretion effector (TIGR04197 family)